MVQWHHIQDALAHEARNLLSDLSTSSPPSRVKRQDTSCTPGSKSQFCQKNVSVSTDLALPVALGVVIPVVFAICVFFWLHRRHVRRLAEEDAMDKHGSLDFGLPEVVEVRPKSKKSKGEPDVTTTTTNPNDALADMVRRTRGMSLDVGSPYILPGGLHDSRASFHSLSRSVGDEDPYRSIALMRASDRASSRHTSRPGSQNRLDNASVSGSSDTTSLYGPKGTLLRHAQYPAKSTPPTSSLANTPPSSPPNATTPTFPPQAFTTNRKLATVQNARTRGSSGSVEVPTRLVREGSDQQGAFVMPSRSDASRPSQDNGEDVSDTASSSNGDSGASKLPSKTTSTSSCTSIDQLAIDERKMEVKTAIVEVQPVVETTQPTVQAQPEPATITVAAQPIEPKAEVETETTRAAKEFVQPAAAATPTTGTPEVEDVKPKAPRPLISIPHFAQKQIFPVELRKSPAQPVSPPDSRRASPSQPSPPADARRLPQMNMPRRSSAAAASPKMASLDERMETGPFEEDATYADVLGIVQSPSTRSPPPAGGRPYSPKMSTIHEPAATGLGVQGFRMPKAGRRFSRGIRPLPPSDPSDDPEQRANRIRSFYREYFDETRPNNKTATSPRPDYYEDYGQEYLSEATIYDPETGRFIVAGAPFAQPVTRRAMTPPPRAPPRFRGSPKPRNSFGSASYQGVGRAGPRAYSSASGRIPAGGRAQYQRRVIMPPSPLNTLPMPSKLTDDMISPIEFAPPQRFGATSPRSGQRLGFSPRAHVPLASSFDDLAAMPSPHALRDSSTFTALDFAPPARFRGELGGSDSGSLRSARSGPALHAAHARAGAYRVSRIPPNVVGTRDDFSISLKPTWDLRS